MNFTPSNYKKPSTSSINTVKRCHNRAFFTLFHTPKQSNHFIFILIISLISNECYASYQRENCEYQASNYSLEWAYEPLTKHIVFVLKTQLPMKANLSYENYWSGIGFSALKDNVLKQFNGIKVNGQKFEILRIESNNNVLDPKTTTSTKIHTIGVEHNAESGIIITKFSRPIMIENSVYNLKLEGCSAFYAPLKMLLIQEISSINFKKYFKRFDVCDIKEHCTINVQQSDIKKAKSEKSKQWSKSETKKLKDPSSTNVELAQSVDISGTGDPCGFVGINYMVNWTYNKKSDCVDFVMRHPVKMGKWWSAVGIGDTMADMDIGVFFLEDGVPKTIIDYYSNSYTVPEKDVHQDWILHKSKSKIVEDVFGESAKKQKIAVTYFSRRINTEDNEKDRTMDGCILFQLAANAARYGGNYALRKHEEWPDLYKACDLKKKCDDSLNAHSVAHSIDDVMENDEIKDQHEGITDFASNNFTHSNLSSNLNKTLNNKNETRNDTVQDATIIFSTNSNTNNSTLPESEEDNRLEELNKNAENDLESAFQPTTTILSLMGEFTTPEFHAEFISENTTLLNDNNTITNTVSKADPITSILLSDSEKKLDMANKNNADAKLEDQTATLTTLLHTTQSTSQTTTPSLTSSVQAALSSTKVSSTTVSPTMIKSSTWTPILTTKLLASTIRDSTSTISSNSLIQGSKNKNIKKLVEKCEPSKPDLDICAGYMENYLGQVKQWADKHNELMEHQFEKACRLLNAVPHVPTLCCHIFHDKCDGHI